MNFTILYIIENFINGIMLKAVLMIGLAEFKKTGSTLVLSASFVFVFVFFYFFLCCSSFFSHDCLACYPIFFFFSLYACMKKVRRISSVGIVVLKESL